MRKLILLALATVAAALTVGSSTANASLPPGGGGAPCAVYGSMVDGSPSAMGAGGYITCPNYPGARVTVTVCLQMYSGGWKNMKCLSAGSGTGYASVAVGRDCANGGYHYWRTTFTGSYVIDIWTGEYVAGSGITPSLQGIYRPCG